MKHHGDITKINGATVEPVEVIIGGSPCQDLSVAGKRAGLAGERSGLFVEMIRIIKEMRENDIRSGRTNDAVRPRYMVWENVPGAFSSNNGEDFRAVLEETARVADENAVIPRPPKGKWTNAGAVMGDGWSVAWRVFDAQFWGVPQRRRRIALVADFGGESAPEILFERVGVSGDIAESGETGQGVAGDFKGCVGETESYAAGFCGGASSTSRSIGFSENVSPTLKGAESGTAQVPAIVTGREPVTYPEIANTLTQRYDGSPQPDKRNGTNVVVYDARGNGNGEAVCTITGDHEGHISDYTALAVYGIDRAAYNQGINALYKPQIERELQPTLTAKGSGAVAADYVVRRLTPTECGRLQGFPDGWTDIGEWTDTKGKKHPTSDANRYKALGNSIALPPWRYVLSRLTTYCKEHTMASLFDGIGGFPLIWEELHGKGSCLWASEIEEFPIAVTRKWFGEKDGEAK